MFSAELWSDVRKRMKIKERLYGVEGVPRMARGRAAGSPYRFTSLLACAICNGSITIVSGKSKKRDDSRYGCSMHAYRGNRVCKNNLLVSRTALERQLLTGLQAEVLHPDVVEYTFRRFEEQLLRRQSGETTAARRRLEEVKRQIRNCTEAIAYMGVSNSVHTKLTELEAEQSELTRKLTSSEPRAVSLELRDTRRFVQGRPKDLQFMWAGDGRLVREEIAKHVRKITLTPVLRTYIATGMWDWLGVLGAEAVTMVPGDRIAPRVHYAFSLSLAA